MDSKTYNYMLWQCETKSLEEDISRAKEHFIAKYPFEFVTILVPANIEIDGTIPMNNILKGSICVAYE